MKRVIYCFAFIILFGSATQAQSMTDVVRTVINIKGKVQLIGEDMSVITPDDNPNMRYSGTNMPSTFRIEGLAVIFSGDVYKIPPNVRALGQPIKFKTIAISLADKKKHQLKKSKYCFK